MPAILRAFDPEEWRRPEDFDPELPGAADYPARHRWQRAVNEWCQANGVDQLEEIRARRAERRAEAGFVDRRPGEPA